MSLSHRGGSGAMVEVRLPNGLVVRGAAVAPVAELVRALQGLS
jgi:hypothetical protein